jgi:hypothetical protein
VKAFVGAVAVNAVVITLLYLVDLDLHWRTSCDTLITSSCRSSVASISYWPFFVIYHLSGNGNVLKSPPILDWIQVLLVALVAFDLSYVYRLARTRVDSKPQPNC